METLVIGLFGFPGAILSLILSVIGILKGKYGWVLLGMAFFLPFCLFLDGTPKFHGTTLLSLLHLVVAYAVRRNSKWLAWIFLVPSVVLILFVLNLSLTSPQ